MRRYVLKKDLPTFKAGQLAYISKQGNLIAGTPDKPEVTNTGVHLMIYHKTTLEKFPEILTEWFEEKEPIDGIYWRPEFGLTITKISVRIDWVLSILLEKECEKARNRKLSKARLRRTSTFEPDFKNGKGGWVVNYSYLLNRLECVEFCWSDHGEPVRYETEEDALKSIKENERDWKIYFGIEEKN